jgi:hypothetical protein
VDFHFRGFTSGSVKTMESRFRWLLQVDRPHYWFR